MNKIIRGCVQGWGLRQEAGLYLSMLLVALVGFWPAMVWHGAAGWTGAGIWLGCLLILFIIIDAIIHDRRVREHNAWVSGKPGQSPRRWTTGGMQ